MGVVLSTLSFNKRNQEGDVVDDVTESPLIIGSYRRLPNMNSEDSPSITDEPSMSSSIIEATVLNQKHNINQQHNVNNNLKNNTIINSPKLIKSPRIRPKAKEISEEEEDDEDEEEDDEPVEMEQLITMMRNHKVSDETSSFNFNFGTGNNNNNNKTLSIPPSPPLPSPSSQSSSRSNWTPSPEFKFSFSANIPQKNHSYADHYIEQEELDFFQGSQQQQNQTANNSDHHYHMIHRKILPMPKPRWKKFSDNDSGGESMKLKTTHNNNNNNNSSSNNKIFNIPVVNEVAENKVDQRDNSKKLKSSPNGISIIQHPIVDNKRKERNWKDHFGSTADVAEFANHEFYSLEKKKSVVRFSSPLKKEVPISHNKISVPISLQPQIPLTTNSTATTTLKSSTTPTTTATVLAPDEALSTTTVLKTTPTISIKKTASKKKGSKLPPTASSSQSTYTKKTNNNNNATITKKKNTHKKRSNKEEVAPGGFLSSNITLFENPISSDDWICLFCQYDILMHDFEYAKKKNGFYRRKREKNKRIKDAELRRLGGGLSESDEDYNEHHQNNHDHL
ncbi:hypothetical protein INT46_009327 [Mucor plumbeus]|uniref:Uncharacterized protein n=1 Tax=Mucor plumbeus TaxID=97098 RepID=A0A8H7USP4_9FUNG|nr:hypothetical protein INT46_009327 [Mucor plumbeus]